VVLLQCQLVTPELASCVSTAAALALYILLLEAMVIYTYFYGFDSTEASEPHFGAVLGLSLAATVVLQLAELFVRAQLQHGARPDYTKLEPFPSAIRGDAVPDPPQDPAAVLVQLESIEKGDGERSVAVSMREPVVPQRQQQPPQQPPLTPSILSPVYSPPIYTGAATAAAAPPIYSHFVIASSSSPSAPSAAAASYATTTIAALTEVSSSPTIAAVAAALGEIEPGQSPEGFPTAV